MILLIHVIFSTFLALSIVGMLSALMLHKKDSGRFYKVFGFSCFVIFLHTMFWYQRFIN